MSHAFPRHTRSIPPMAVSGHGCYLVDASGKEYFDGSGGAAVSCLGHGDLEIIAAIQAQAGKLAFAHTGFFTTEPAEALCDLLIEHAPGSLDRVYLVSGGSEAVESALKLARQYFIETGEPNRRHIIARRQSYHGNTLGALSAGGNLWRREPFAPLLVDVKHISPCYEYAEKHENESSEEYGQRAANELESAILELGQDTVMAFIAEPVVGATAGAVPSVEGYFKRIREICDHYGILLILDEVMCGMGRTGYLFACDHDQIAPDILCIAKGLGAGYQPVGAMLCTDQIYEAIERGSGFFQHGHTYLAHPVATAASLAVVNAIINRDLVSRVRKLGKNLDQVLKERFADHPHVGDIRGRGLFVGIELVRDKSTKEPFSPAKGLARQLKQTAFDNGLICYPMSGTRDGINGDHILLAPPFIMTDDQLDELTDKLSLSINKVLPV